ncbi:hypothetical protein DQ04_01031060 [Trypanosoma grayi]|uniref:hypothetical protein n=1 Tax=Trypanosoma grayi TaxID=71804 RepID=UPI0004F412BA|nr:hypothetical protein DQ04_01031060 [Trypanosoma grayi]KEG13393.1 hypothetical protein DQ04_01031060 [Trypanosoma grayi]
MRADSAATVRPYPYPSLFLHPLPPGLCEHPYAPPPFLLAAPPPTPTAAGCDGQVSGSGPKPNYRDMFALNGGATEMVTVLEGECGLAVISPRGGSVRPRGVYLMSPDATSCIIVACRVGLHPLLRQRLLVAIEGDAVSEDAALARRCCETFTAAMGHFNQVDGVAQALYDMLWEAALPAWFHAALYDVDEACTCGGGGGGGAWRAAKDLLARLHRVARTTAAAFARASEPTLLTEWFVVGGIRSREHTVPILSGVFGTFFAEDGVLSGATCPRDGRHHVLKPSLDLSEILGGNNGMTEEETDGAPVLFEHRLREDGVCFWSLSTVLRPWVLGRAGELYSCAACWGLLLDVGGGGCWPVMVQPGTRKYTLAALRHLLHPPGYSWLCPLEREGVLRVSRRVATTCAAVYFGLNDTSAVCDTSYISLLNYVELFLERREADVGAGSETVCSPAPVLIRRAEWMQMEKGGLPDDIPDRFFLQFSTTPHCEPPDFVAVVRQQFTDMAEFSVEDVFEKGMIGILV